MTTVIWHLGRDERFKGFQADGHAGDQPAGQNVVCAAISAILQTAVLGLTEVCRIEAVCHADDETGHLSCSVPRWLSEEASIKADVILRTAACGLKSIQMGYPEALTMIEEVKPPCS
nr:ribosomal-processing cysteine protease Prp [bacterium]